MLLPIVFGVSRPCQQLVVHVCEQGDLNLRQDGGRPFQIAVIPLLVLRQFCFRQELVCLKGMSGMGMFKGMVAHLRQHTQTFDRTRRTASFQPS